MLALLLRLFLLLPGALIPLTTDAKDWPSAAGTTAKGMVIEDGAGNNISAGWKANGVWQRQGVSISPTLQGELGNVQEPNIIGPEATCTLLPSQFASCFKMVYTGNSGTPVLYYAESPDGLTGWVKSPTSLAGGRSSFWVENTASCTLTISGTTATVSACSSGVLSNGQYITGGTISAGTKITARGTGTGGAGTYTVNNSQTVSTPTAAAANAYYLIAADASWGQINIFTAQNSIGPYSSLQAAAVTPGTAGQWDDHLVTNTSGLWQSDGKFYLFLEGYSNGGACTQGGIGLFTSTDMSTFTQPVTNPVLRSAAGAGCDNQRGGPTIPFLRNSVWYMWVHCAISPAAALPADICMYTASSLTAASWTASSSNPVFSRLTADEGVQSTAAQVVDPFVVEYNNKTYLWYTANTDGNVNIAGANFQIKVAVADMPLASVVGTTQGSSLGSSAISTYIPANVDYLIQTAGTYSLVFPIGAKEFQFDVRGQGGCGGGGGSIGAVTAGSGGGGGGGAGFKSSAWIPISQAGAGPTVIIGTQCTAAAAAANGGVGGNAQFNMTGMDNTIAYGGGGGAGGASVTNSGGGGGAGSTGVGSNSTGATGGNGGNFGGSNGGSGGGASNASNPMGGSGGGGTNGTTGVAGQGAATVSASTGGGGGGGCAAGGTPQGGGIGPSAVNSVNTAGGNAGGATGSPGGTGQAAFGWGGGGGSGGGAGTTTGGVGATGGFGGGGGGGGGAGCGGTGGTGGVGGAAYVVIRTR